MMEDQSVFRKKSLERISSPEQLNDYIKVSNPSVWIVIAALIILLGATFYWGFAGSIPSKVTCNGITVPPIANSELVTTVKCYVPSSNANVIGQAYNNSTIREIKVTPSESEGGYITGEVKSVSNTYVSFEELQDELGEFAAARILPNGGYAMELVISLDRSLSKTDKLNWSSDKNNTATLYGNTICEIDIITQLERPIEFLTGSNS